ncbi:MAG: hypothetical protein Q9220_004749 [cf. Caloplaca sp. 1 TL-2023]
MASPLAQQNRPSSFQPKIDSLYDQLFSIHEEYEFSLGDGFWREFFLLRPDKASLRRRLNSLSVDDLLHIQEATQQLFRRAVDHINAGNGISDEAALDVGIVLSKRYTNPSSEIITLLAGLDEVDAVFLDFANTLERIIRSGPSEEVRRKAIEVAIALVAGASQTSLVSYFTHRDLFPCLIKCIAEQQESSQLFDPLCLLGLLANYNKFEFRNPYRLRLEDFVNESAIQKIIQGLGTVCSRSRGEYIAIQEDVEEGWNLSSTLKYIGLGVLAPSRSSTPTPVAGDPKDLFATLPDTDATILLTIYEFTNANKLFAQILATQPGESKVEPAFSVFLSLTSYILHHAHRSTRSTLYGCLNLITLRILIEDQTLCAKLFSADLSHPVRLCRQRQPFLPSTPLARPYAASILDICIDTITHNLRRRLHIPLYICTLNLIHRLLSFCLTARTRFPYHWSLLWQTLLSLLRFLATYHDALVHEPDLPVLIDTFLSILALAVCSGDAFLPDTDSQIDLFYKLVESAHLLPSFKSAFSSLSRPASIAPATPNAMASTSPTALVDTLIAVSGHFTTLLDEEKGKGSSMNLSPREVSRVIRKGCESLSVPETEGLERWVRWREVDEKGFLKRVGRCVVEDARRMGGR